METSNKKDKRKAWAITIVFHVILLLIFLFVGLSQPVPLPEEAGATIEFGWDTQAGGDAIAEVVSEIPEPVEEEPVKNEPTVTEEIIEEDVATDEASEVAVTPAKEEKPKKPKEEPKPTVSDKLSNAMNNAWNAPAGGGSQGENEGLGNEGNPDGGPGKGALGGGGGSWELSGRSMSGGYGSKITDTREEGIVVLNIWVDRQGNVTRVQPNLKESNTTSQYLINLARTDVMNNFKFNASAGANVEQKGKVRFVFQLK